MIYNFCWAHQNITNFSFLVGYCNARENPDCIHTFFPSPSRSRSRNASSPLSFARKEERKRSVEEEERFLTKKEKKSKKKRDPETMSGSNEDAISLDRTSRATRGKRYSRIPSHLSFLSCFYPLSSKNPKTLIPFGGKRMR